VLLDNFKRDPKEFDIWFLVRWFYWNEWFWHLIFKLQVSDEEAAKKLHHAMNSSPWISTSNEKVIVCEKVKFDEDRYEKRHMERPRVKRKRLLLNELD
jgi:hypothetical protein